MTTDDAKMIFGKEVTSEYEPILPLDMYILRELPPEGTMFADVYPLGEAVSSLKKKIAEGKLTSEQLSTRMRIMLLHGIVAKIKTIGHAGKHAWQITSKGAEVLKEWEISQIQPAATEKTDDDYSTEDSTS